MIACWSFAVVLQQEYSLFFVCVLVRATATEFAGLKFHLSTLGARVFVQKGFFEIPTKATRSKKNGSRSFSENET